MAWSLVAFLALLLAGPAYADHTIGLPANCPDDVSGSWQGTSTGSTAFSTSEISVTSTGICRYEVTLGSQPSTLDITGLGPLAAIYASDPSPFGGHVSSINQTMSPLTGTFQIQVFFLPPEPVIPAICGATPIGAIVFDRVSTGTITQASAGIATEIVTASTDTNFVFFEAGGGPNCPNTVPDGADSGILLRNAVATGTNVVVTPTPGVTLDFGDVTTAGTVLVGVRTTAQSPLAPNFQLFDGLFFEITSTAVFDPLVQVEVCITYVEDPPGILKGTTTAEASIQLRHDPGGGFVDVTSFGYPDIVANVVCGKVDSFSFLAVVGTNAHIPALSLGPSILVLALLLSTGLWWMRARSG